MLTLQHEPNRSRHEQDHERDDDEPYAAALLLRWRSGCVGGHRCPSRGWTEVLTATIWGLPDAGHRTPGAAARRALRRAGTPTTGKMNLPSGPPCQEDRPLTVDHLNALLLVSAPRAARRRGWRCGSPSAPGCRACCSTWASGWPSARTGSALRFNDARADPGAGLRRAGGDPGRGRPEHELARDPARGAGRRRAGHPRRRGQRRGSPRGARTTWSDLELAAGPALGAVRVLDRRRRGLLGAAPGAAAARG